MRVDPARAVLLVLHGNAGTALDRIYLRDVFQAAAPVEVALLEYPGYGPRAGVPSQQTLVSACRDAVTLLARGGLPVVIVGESLGSAVAVLCAADEPDSGLGSPTGRTRTPRCTPPRTHQHTASPPRGRVLARCADGTGGHLTTEVTG